MRVPSVPFRASSATVQILDSRNLTHRHVIDGRFAISFDLRPELDRVMRNTLSPVPTVRQEQALKARESEAQLGIGFFKHFLIFENSTQKNLKNQPQPMRK